MSHTAQVGSIFHDEYCADRPEGRFIPVNMDWCQDLMGGLFEHVTPALLRPAALATRYRCKKVNGGEWIP